MNPKEPKKAGRPAGKRGAEDHPARQRILEAAMEIFAMHGFDGCTMRDIGRHSGLHNSLAAYYFNTKQAIWAAAVEQMHTRAQPGRDAIREISLAETLPLHIRINGALKILIDEFIRQPTLGFFIGLTTPWQGERHEIVLERLVNPYKAAILPLLKQGVSEKIIAPQDPKTLFTLLMYGVGRAVCVHSETARSPDGFGTTDPARAEAVLKNVQSMLNLKTEPQASTQAACEIQNKASSVESPNAAAGTGIISNNISNSGANSVSDSTSVASPLHGRSKTAGSTATVTG